MILTNLYELLKKLVKKGLKKKTLLKLIDRLIVLVLIYFYGIDTQTLLILAIVFTIL